MAVLAGDAYPATYTAPGDYLAGATVTLTVTAPDGTVTTPAVTKDPATATATATVPAPVPGDYLLVWQVSGSIVDVEQDQFTAVTPALQLLNLADLVDLLNLDDPDQETRAKLRRWIAAAANVVENICGPVLAKPRTDYFDGDVDSIVLPFRWVRSITAVSEIIGTTAYPLTEQPLGASVDAYGYTWDRSINALTRRAAGGAATRFAAGIGAVRVQYVLGLASIPPDIQLGAAELIGHWYRRNDAPGQMTVGYPVQDAPEDVAVGNYLVPRRVMELFRPWARRPGIF